MQACLELDDLWRCVEGEAAYIADARKVTRAKSKIILSVEPINYVHIQNARDARQTWQNLAQAFEDSGLTRRVGLLRTLVTTTLDNCESTEQYVNTIVTTAHKLNGIGFQVGDVWIGTLLLAGLPEEFRPMIMGIESSGTPVTADSIKTKILQDVKHGAGNGNNNSNADTALNSRGHKTRRKVDPRCYSCGKVGHIASKCSDRAKKPKKESTEEGNRNFKSSKAFYAPYANSSKDVGDWYVDSGASSHMTSREDLLASKKSVTADVNTASKVDVK